MALDELLKEGFERKFRMNKLHLHMASDGDVLILIMQKELPIVFDPEGEKNFGHDYEAVTSTIMNVANVAMGIFLSSMRHYTGNLIEHNCDIERMRGFAQKEVHEYIKFPHNIGVWAKALLRLTTPKGYHRKALATVKDLYGSVDLAREIVEYGARCFKKEETIKAAKGLEYTLKLMSLTAKNYLNSAEELFEAFYGEKP